jgi:Cu2+-exporting ATPase
MTLLAIAGISGTLAVAVKVYRDAKEKREKPWIYYATRKGIVSLGLPTEGKETGQRVQEGKLALFFTDTRLEQLRKLSPLTETNPNEVSGAEKKLNRYLVYSSISLGLATAGTLFYPPLILLSLPGLIYGTIPVWKEAFRTFQEEHRFGFYALESILLPAMLLSGHFLAASLTYTLYFFSEKLLVKTKESSKKSLSHIFGEQPRFVWVLTNGVEVKITFDSLKIDDVVVINAGELIPVDGTIIDGIASIDQRVLTGESQPAEKERGGPVFASTVVLSGRIYIRVKKTGQDTVAAQIGEILRNTTDFKSKTELKGEEISNNAALPTLLLATAALPIIGSTGALAIMCISVGDTIRMAAPISILNFIQITSQEGILIKDGRALELLSEVDTIVFDKTGALTEEVPHIGAIYTCQGINETELLTYAAAAENKQTHPIARAILWCASNRELSLPEIDSAAYEIGYGLKVRINQKVVLVGSKRFMEMSEITIPSEINTIQQQCNEHGYSLVYVALDGQLAGAIELHATIRPEAKQIISELRQRGLTMYIISGDHEKPTKKLAQELGIQHYFAETLPENKAELVKQLQNEGKVVCFIGDGINDSIALKTANVSISLHGASTIATDTASIILMDENLTQLVQLFDLATALNSNMKSNLVISIVPAVVTIGGAFFLHFGIFSAITLYSVGLLAGVANAMRPMINYQRKSPTRLFDVSPKAQNLG